ncbi:LysE family translocator [Roseomonas chloroacetimidivorans]|uniref:LysE family translocator n=1 Tax=Roseomonas chloroacetimidivorans TaxID=1766656 RepID=UPI003C72AC54
MLPPAGQYVIFLSIVTVIVVTPGPNLFLLLGTAPGAGRQIGVAATLGICAAILSHAALALVGVGAIIATSAILFTALKVIGAFYLIWMGIRSLLSLRRSGGLTITAGGGRSAPSISEAFVRGYLTNILNPKPAIFYVAVFPQFLVPHPTGFYARGAALALTHAAVAMLFYGCVVLAMSGLTRVLLRPAVSRVVKSLSGLALILLGGRLLMTRAPT